MAGGLGSFLLRLGRDNAALAVPPALPGTLGMPGVSPRRKGAAGLGGAFTLLQGYAPTRVPVVAPYAAPAPAAQAGFANLSYELAGSDLGFAQAWVWRRQASACVIAGYGAPELPWETFSNGWENDAYKFAFTGFGIDLAQAAHPTVLSPFVKLVEDFSEYWSSNEGYRFGKLDDAVAAVYNTGTPLAYEPFEAEWNTNQSYKFAFTGIGTDLTAGSYNAITPLTYEPFEAEWNTNQSYKFAFTGIGTDLTAASYNTGTPLAYEPFEVEWVGYTMTTI